MKKILLATALFAATIGIGNAQSAWDLKDVNGMEPHTSITEIDLLDNGVIWIMVESNKEFYDDTVEDEVENINYNELYRRVGVSTDNGDTWKFSDPVDSEYAISTIEGIDATTAYIITNGTNKVFKTTDGGDSWEDQELTFSFGNVLHFWENGNGFAMGDPEDGEHKIYHYDSDIDFWTPVSGDNIPDAKSEEWSYVGVPDYVREDGTVYVGTNKGTLLKTTDGLTWSIQNTPDEVTDFANGHAEDSKKMWAYPIFKDDGRGLIYTFFTGDESKGTENASTAFRTTDGGASWEEINLSTIEGINAPLGVTEDSEVFMPYKVTAIPNTDIIVANDNQIFKTAISLDFGASWFYAANENRRSISCLKFSDSDNGYAGGTRYKQVSTGDEFGGLLSFLPEILSNETVDLNEVKGLYPNPSNGETSINVSLNNIDVNVHALTGAKVATLTSDQNGRVDVSSLENGVYLVTVNKNVFKLVVNN